MNKMSLGALLVSTGALALACNNEPEQNTDECSVSAQNTWVKDTLQEWHLVNDQLPDLDPRIEASPEAFLASLVRDVDLAPDSEVDGIDSFSFVYTLRQELELLNNVVTGFGLIVRIETVGTSKVIRVLDVLGRLADDDPSPASQAGLRRGDAIVELNGTPIADALPLERLLGTVFNFGVDAGVTWQFGIRRRDASEVEYVTLTSAALSPNTVPLAKVIQRGDTSVGYIFLRGFDFASIEKLRLAFRTFANHEVDEVIIDVRYNLGGIILVADYLASLMLGNDLAGTQTVIRREAYNQQKSADYDTEVVFSEPACPAILLEHAELAPFVCEGEVTGLTGLRKLVFITSRTTASAAEVVINSMQPHVDVSVIGERTFGKPVGSLPFPAFTGGAPSFCGLVLRPTTIRNINANGEGDFFGGIPSDCDIADDPRVEIGDENDGSIAAALAFLADEECPTNVSNGLRAVPPRRRALLDADNVFGYSNSLARFISETAP